MNVEIKGEGERDRQRERERERSIQRSLIIIVASNLERERGIAGKFFQPERRTTIPIIRHVYLLFVPWKSVKRCGKTRRARELIVHSSSCPRIQARSDG